MRDSWPPAQLSALATSDWGREEEVLVEFNGPQVVVFANANAKYLAVASDDDAEVVRWIVSPVSLTELRALKCGATTLRDCLMKPEVWVTDRRISDSAVVKEFKVASADLHEDALPSVGSFLPEFFETQRPLLESEAMPCLTLDGAAVKHHAIGVAPFVEVLRHLQRLWTALGQVTFGEANATGKVATAITARSVLMVNAFAPGSVKVSLTPSDGQAFNVIASQYEKLVTASSEPEKLREVFKVLKSRVRATYGDYLNAIAKHDVEVFAQWSHSATFISPHTAARIAPALTATEQSHPDETFRAEGMFLAFSMVARTFDFLSTDAERYAGTLSQSAFDALPHIVIGVNAYLATLLIATLRVIEGEEKQTAELVQLEYLKPEEVADPEAS